MEATSPRFRYVPIMEYGMGWALNGVITPPLNWLTRDYRLFFGALLAWQLLMIPWLIAGVFESIRWLLSEGHINRAQIELNRACRMNRVQTSARLAQEIARIQAQQLRKASRKQAGAPLPQQQLGANPSGQSPFGWSRTDEHEQESSFFLCQMLHPKLRPTTLLMVLVSIVYETSYYGFIQSNRIVGKSVSLNYLFGLICDLIASCATCFMLARVARKFSLITTTLLGSICCLAMAAVYQFMVNGRGQLATFESLKPEARVNLSSLTEAPLGGTQQVLAGGLDQENLNNLRQWLLLAIMLVGRFMIVIGIQVGAAIAMESYPNNLRQTGPGAILFFGRSCSIAAPLLFNDPSADKLMLKLTLLALGLTGLLVCCLIPMAIRDNKDKDLCDRLDEIEDK